MYVVITASLCFVDRAGTPCTLLVETCAYEHRAALWRRLLRLFPPIWSPFSSRGAGRWKSPNVGSCILKRCNSSNSTLFVLWLTVKWDHWQCWPSREQRKLWHTHTLQSLVRSRIKAKLLVQICPFNKRCLLVGIITWQVSWHIVLWLITFVLKPRSTFTFDIF